MPINSSYTNLRKAGSSQASKAAQAKKVAKTTVGNPAASAAADMGTKPSLPTAAQSLSGAAAGLPSGNTFNASSAPLTGGGSAVANGQGTDPWGGFAGRYKPTDFGSLYSSPNLIGNDILSGMGYNPQGALGGVLGDTAGAFRNLADFYALAQGGGSPERFVNTMGDLLGQQMTVGGRDVDYREMLGMLLGAQGGSNDPLYAMLTQGTNGLPLTPEDQISMLTDTANLARLGMTPMTARAFSALLGQGGTQWQGSQLGNAAGADPNFIDYLQRTGLLDQLR